MKPAKEKELYFLGDYGYEGEGSSYGSEALEKNKISQFLKPGITDEELREVMDRNRFDINEKLTFYEHTDDDGMQWVDADSDSCGAEEWPLYLSYGNANILIYIYLAQGANSALFNKLLHDPRIKVDATYSEEGVGGYFKIKHGKKSLGFQMINATILHLAAAINDYDAVKKICESNRVDANVEAELYFEDQKLSITKVTPIHLAARWANVRLMKLLINHGANLQAMDSDKKSVTKYALQTKKDKELLLKEPNSNAEDLEKIDENQIKNFFMLVGENGTWWLGRNRLFLGEGDFSFTKAFYEKHNKKHIRPRIAASEISKKDELIKTHGKGFEKHIKELERLGIRILFNVDATKIDTHKTLHRKERYTRIHFNFPHNRNGNVMENGSLREIIHDFFKAANNIQDMGDKVLISIPDRHPKAEYGSQEYRHQMHLALTYGLAESSIKNGYELEARRSFNSSRYSEYSHCMTQSSNSANVAEDGIEYVFKKISLPVTEEQFNQKKRTATTSGFFYAPKKTTGLFFKSEPTVVVDSSDDMETDGEKSVKHIRLISQN